MLLAKFLAVVDAVGRDLAFVVDVVGWDLAVIVFHDPCCCC